MKIYHYDREYNHFINEGTADQSPLDPPGVWLIPAYATEIKPPQYSEGFIPVFNGESWELIVDNRGIYYDKTTSDKIEHYNPHICPENVTKEVPPEIPSNGFIVWENGWVIKLYTTIDPEMEDLSTQETLTPIEKIERTLGLTIDEIKILLDIN